MTKQNFYNYYSRNQPLIIMELSANHMQDLEIAKKTLIAAKENGAHAIKLQTYTADTLTLNCDNAYFTIKDHPLWKGQTLYDLYNKAHTPWKWHQPLQKLAHELDLLFFSSPFDTTAVDFLESLEVPCYKIASFTTEHYPLLKAIGRTGKPVIISRGMTSINQLKHSIKLLKDHGCSEVFVLHCVSAYPAPIEEMNLSTIIDLKDKLNCAVGLSDHTLSFEVPIAATALGATLIEKHFILDRSFDSPDAPFSITPSELKQLASSLKKTFSSIGKPDYQLTSREKASVQFKPSIFVAQDINKGQELTLDNIKIVRPGDGLSPIEYENCLGRKASKDLAFGDPLNKGDFI